jgi:hypothetical protein
MHATFPRTFARRVTMAALAVVAMPVIAAAQSSQPTVDQVVERYLQAIGGRAAVMGQTSSRTVARVELPAMGMAGNLEVLVASPGNMLQKMNFPGLGDSQAGVVGGRAWAIDPMQGARLVTGAEAEQNVHATDPTVAVRDPKHFTTREIVDEREYEGQRCIAVRFVWTSGRESVDCFSTETGLLVASSARMDSPMGAMEVLTIASDYKEFGGVKMPTKLRQSMMGMEQVITIESVEVGTVTAADIQPPAAIRTLLDR